MLRTTLFSFSKTAYFAEKRRILRSFSARLFILRIYWVTPCRFESCCPRRKNHRADKSLALFLLLALIFAERYPRIHSGCVACTIQCITFPYLLPILLIAVHKLGLETERGWKDTLRFGDAARFFFWQRRDCGRLCAGFPRRLRPSTVRCLVAALPMPIFFRDG